MDQKQGDVQTAISCLLHAIDDTQGTIRAYDMKANSLGVLLTLALGLSNISLLQSPAFCTKNLLFLSLVLGLLALFALGLVLRPVMNPVKKINFGNYVPTKTYFVDSKSLTVEDTVDVHSRRTVQTDWVAELTYEKMKLASIRSYKHSCFTWAVVISGATLVLIAIAIVTHVGGCNG